MKEIGIILLITAICVGCVSSILFYWILQRHCRVSAIISNSENTNGAPALNETSSTVSSFESTIGSIDLDMSRRDLPPSYEMGLVTETPPPAFDTLFPSVPNLCNDMAITTTSTTTTILTAVVMYNTKEIAS